MKKAITVQFIILVFATFVATAISFFVGGFSNNSFTFYWNTLLINITFMGDAFFAFGLVFFLLFFFNKKSSASKLLIALIISLTITQFIKNIFSGLPPQLFFEEGILKNSGGAFFNKNIISSHSAIAFTLASFFVLHIKNSFIKILVIILAIIIAITRISLGGDSLMALGLGLFPAIAAFFYLYNLKQKHKIEVSNNGYYYKSRKEKQVSTGKQFSRV